MDLSRNFTLEEMPCWESASPQDVERLRVTVALVLQPVRTRWGFTRVSSWKWWRNGCTPRTGSHREGGTVDFTTRDADLWQVFQWGLENLPRSYVGRWIYEPEIRGPTGELEKGEHIHMAPIPDMWGAHAKADSSAWVEGPQGVYTAVPGWGGSSGAYDDPIELEGLTVTVGKPWPLWPKLFIAGLAFGLFLRSTSGTPPRPPTQGD